MTYTDLVSSEPSPGDALAVRSDEKYIAAGVVDEYTSPAECSEGELVAVLSDPIMWCVCDGRAKPIELDHGPTIDYRYDDGQRLGSPEDWDGPSVTIGIGHDNDEVVLRLPDPVWDSKGVRYYFPQTVGGVVTASTGGLIDPSVLLEPDEQAPNREVIL